MEGRIKAFGVQKLVGREPHGRVCRGWKGKARERKLGLEKEGSVKEARKLLRTAREGSLKQRQETGSGRESCSQGPVLMRCQGGGRWRRTLDLGTGDLGRLGFDSRDGGRGWTAEVRHPT